MVVVDKREKWIISTASNFFGVVNSDVLQPEDHQVLDKFLDNANCRTLCAQPETDDQSPRLKLSNELATANKSLVFFKLHSAVITTDNFHELVQVTSTIKNPGSALIESLRQVWAPTLQSSGVNVTCLKKLEEDILGPGQPTSLLEEEIFWKKKREATKKHHEKKLIDEIVKIIREIIREVENAATSREGLPGVEEVLESISGLVDDLWKLEGPIYTQNLMEILLDIVGNETISLVQSFLDEVRNEESRVKDEAFSNGATVCQKWVDICERLTSLFWPHQSLHPWKGPPFVPSKCHKFGERLKQIAEIRLQYRQLTRLLTDVEKSSLGTEKLMQNFDEFRVNLDDDRDIEWERLKMRFEEGLAPAEERVVEKLKKHLAKANSPVLLVGEFQTYIELLKRPRILQALQSECQTLFSSLDDIIDIYQSDPDTKGLLDIPQVFQKIQTARLAEVRLENLHKLCKDLLIDLPGYKDAMSKISSASKNAEERRQTTVTTWINETRNAIVKKELTLEADSPVVELIGKNMMKVNYDPKLTGLVREARAISAQGIELPREIINLVERAGALIQRARALQQISNFHNTIVDRMIPSQRPLMLSTALELARAAQEQSGVIWSDLNAVDAYTNRLKEFTQKLAKQNSELAAKHVYLRDLVVNLLKGEVINLVSSQNVWKDTLRTMRTVVDEVDSVYGNTKAWKFHWDHQLLKVLDLAYRAALQDLVKKLPEIQVELIVRDNCLQFRPPLEEIRAKLYSGIRRFLILPKNFRGVGDPNDAKFGSIIQRNAYLFGSVYKQAELALNNLKEMKKKWEPLAELAKFDINERLKGKPAGEWEKAFKDAKHWAQEIGKLRGGEIKMWCFTIDTSTTRNDLESATRRYWDRLSSEIRLEASSRLVIIVEFLSAAARELDRRPNNIEEVSLACESHSRVEKESEGIREELESVTGLAKVMAAWTREKLEGISGAHAAWEGLSGRLERHKAVIARQLEDAKINLRHRAVALRDERERWETRWSSKPETINLDWVASMRERWVSLEEQKDTLMSDCQRVNLELDITIEEDPSVSRRIESELDAEESNCRFIEEFLKELEGQEDEEWAVARRRLPRLHDWLDSWSDRIKSQLQKPDEHPETNNYPVETFVGKKIREIREKIEWVQLLKGDELAEEHWNELKSIINLEKNLKDLTLGDIFKVTEGIKENSERIKEITKRAAAESGIRQALIELEAWEASASLQIQEFKDSRNQSIQLVGEYGEILTRAGELKLLLEGAKSATGYDRFAARAGRCETALFELEERIKLLGSLQRKWIYLEPVYTSGAAPNDSGRWTRADKEFRYLMNEVARDPKVPSLRRLPLPALSNLKDLLDRCQRSLDEFLEEKRLAYPRLYFLSDEDLLELISGSVTGLNNHLPKLYQGVGSITCENESIKSVVSPEGEILNLLSPIDLKEPLSTWLFNLESIIKTTLSKSLDKCLQDSNPDISNYPAQILLLVERIRFTERCEEALKTGRMELKHLIEFLEIKRAKFRGLEDMADSLTSQKARSLLLDTVHHLGIARNLLTIVENNQKTSWTWNRQLRCYKTSQGPVIKCAGAEFEYGFEYQGAVIGLVRTELTERCFLALTQAMKLGLGGSPTGPAGTGKTESVKALASILGRLVLVFNCDEGMDASSMKRILGGLAQAGVWGCFDEFNRLEEKTLSAVSMLIRPLQESIRDGLNNVQFGSDNIKLNHHCSIFITMNPADNDYGGRNKLPDSLARLFRPIGMAHPDKCDITKALLECAGFLEASNLANKLVETLDISEKLLSKQPHYDWGLRALRSILDAISGSSAQQNESQKLLQAIKTSVLPKLTENDTEKFNQLLEDVFPKVDPSKVLSTQKEDLKKLLKEICDVKNLGEDVVNRCEQLYDQLQSRTGVVIVGPPGSGKTLVRKILYEGLTKAGDNLKEVLIYPGAIPKTRLLGRVDSQSREWKDGLLSAIISSNNDNPLWVVFDGNVEPGWAEALNSALDDNRILTLASGVGIKLGPRVRFIFETHELSSASPATVSRLGVVHLANSSVSSLLPPSAIDSLPAIGRSMASQHLASIIESVHSTSSESSSISSLISLCLVHLERATTVNLVTNALLLSLCLQRDESEQRKHLAKLIYQSTDSWCPDPDKPLDVLYNDQLDRLEPFSNTSTSIQSNYGPISLSDSLKRGLAAILPWIEAGKPVLIRGLRGSGKSSLIAAALSSLKNDLESLNIVRGSSLFGSQDLITRLKRSCVRVDSSANGRVYRPRNGAKIILILEDFDLASQELQELVRQLIEEGGFFEDDLEFARLPIVLIATGNNSGPLHPRLNALLATHYLPSPTYNDLLSIAEIHLQNSKLLNHSAVSNIAITMQESLSAISSTKESSFQWNSKDLTLWAQILTSYPSTEGDNDIYKYIFDIGVHLFSSKLTSKDQQRWKSTILLKFPDVKTSPSYIYIWKSGLVLTPIAEESWKVEIENVSSKCAREGEPIQAILTPNLLKLVGKLSWSFGCNHRGVILTGRPGAGRRTSVKLASYYSSLKLIESAPGRGKAGIKLAVQTAGIDGEPTVLLLEEHHMREEGLLILAGAIISNGEIPGLLTSEELDGLVAPLNDLARKEEFTGTLDQFLYHRIRHFLRVVFIVDSGDLKSKDLVHSGLIQHCIILSDHPGNEWWIQQQSLLNLGTQIIQKYRQNTEEEEGEEVPPGLDTLVNTHLRVSHYQQAPARFIAVLHTWQELKQQWLKDLESKIVSLNAGIGKLKEAGEKISKLEDEASKQRKELEEEQRRANSALEQITATMRGATGQRGEMTTLKADTERESAELARQKVAIENELGKVEPLVEAAAQSVAGIGADALSEVRSLRAPPAPVRDVLEGVLRLMGIRDTSWNSMKTFLAKRGIKDEIRSWDARRSTPASLDAVAKLVKERPESFEEKTARRASVAAAPLAAWVLANLQYGQILQQVAPLERQQRALSEKLSAAQAQIGKLAAGLSSVESRVAELQEELAEHSRSAAVLQLKTESTESNLATARALLQKLDVEYNDWQNQLENLTVRKYKLNIEAAEAASLLVYQDPNRDEKSTKSSIDLLVSERERLLWRAQDLPADSGSLIGAICALRGPLIPFFVDPSSVAVTWLKSHLNNQLEVTNPEDSKFLMTLELAVRFGKPLLVEEIVIFPAILLSLLRKRPLKIGDRILPIQQGFKLFLATRRDISNLLPSESDAVLFKISLGVGSRSLAERFIDKALLRDTPQLYKERREALELEERLSGEQDAARLDLLMKLGGARGQDLLQESLMTNQSDQPNDSLLSSLDAIQTKAKEIALTLDESRKNRENISKRFKQYEKSAKFAANLFKAIKSLTTISPLYVFSSESFTDIYLEASGQDFAESETRKDQESLIEKKLIALTLDHCLKAVYRKHRLALALHLTLSLNPVAEVERNILEDKSIVGKTDDNHFNVPNWIPNERKSDVKLLATTLPQIGSKMCEEWINDMKIIYKDQTLTSFQKVLIIQAFRPDYLHTALTKFATDTLGVKDLTPPGWTLDSVNQTNRPVLLLLSPGADPGPELTSLATNLKLPQGFVEVSLGQGQVEQAEIALENACRNGGWILLSNLQLALNWLPRLENLLRSDLCTKNKNPLTKIWLTTEECSGFYPGLAGICLKLAYEPPEGVKRNLKRSLHQLQQHRPNSKNSEGIFVLAWLHAILQERRKFIPHGWIRPYEWNESDLEAARELVVNYALKFNPEANLDWEEGRGLLDVAIYGGRLQDQFDMRALQAIIYEIWSKDIFHGRFKLSGLISVPDVTKKDILRVIDQTLPDVDSPLQLFGLPSNALRAWERSAADNVLSILKNMSNFNDGKVKRKIDPKLHRDLKSLLERLKGFETVKVKKASLNPVDEFFNDERNILGKLISNVKSDVNTNKLCNSTTPKSWLEDSTCDDKDVYSFINNLILRNNYISRINFANNQRINLDLLSRPKAFLAALKQYTARETGNPIEQLKLKTNWIDKDADLMQWKVSVVVENILISGGIIKNSQLQELDDNKPPINSAPLCQITYLPDNNYDYDSNYSNGDDVIDIPFYKDSQRNHFITTLSVNYTKLNKNQWLKRGIILYLGLN